MTTDSHPTSAASPLRVAVIIGSTREGRNGKAIAEWFAEVAGQRSDLEVDLVDLAEFDLPFHYSMEPTPDIEAFAQRIDIAEAAVVVTPEYNHSYPASIKTALDYTHDEWLGKPVGFISYGGMAQGSRAVEHLRVVFAELHTTTIRDQLSFDLTRALDDNGRPHGEGPAQAAKVMVDQLHWWGIALRNARAARPYGTAADPDAEEILLGIE